jgi:hypothetical protein
MKNSEVTILVLIFTVIDVACSIMYDISSQNFNSGTVFNGQLFDRC